jgi:O-antigen/teichoic acid export membrane protein
VVLLDQGMSSVSNVLAIILVARSLSADDFGRFALGFAVLTAVLTLTRAYFGTRVSMVKDPVDGLSMTGSLVGALVLVGPALALVVMAVSLAGTGGASVGVLAIVAVATPIVCIQDVVRFGAVASDRAPVALVSDTVWVLLMLLPFVLGIDLSPSAALLLWFGAAVVAMIVALVLLGEVPHFRSGVTELKQRHAVGESLTYASVISVVAALWIVFAASQFVGAAAAGSLRGAAAAMGPLNVLIAYSALGLTPLLVRRDRSRDLSYCSVVAVAMGGLTLAWGAVLLVLPNGWGQALLGDSWTGVREILPWIVAEYVGLTVAAAVVLGLKVRQRSRDIVVQRVASGVVTVVGGGAAAVFVGTTWSIAAMLVVAAWASVFVGGVLFAASTRTSVPRASVPSSTEEVS